MSDTTAAVRLPRQRTLLPLVPLARALARTAHMGQADSRGRDLFAHYLTCTVAALSDEPPTLQAAGWLHLVLARTEYTTNTLQVAGLPVVVIDVVNALTRGRRETIAEHAARLHQHPSAWRVLAATYYATHDPLETCR